MWCFIAWPLCKNQRSFPLTLTLFFLSLSSFNVFMYELFMYMPLTLKKCSCALKCILFHPHKYACEMGSAGEVKRRWEKLVEAKRESMSPGNYTSTRAECVGQ